MQENNKIAEVRKAWAWVRENNQSIPDDILDLMKDAAIEKLAAPLSTPQSVEGIKMVEIPKPIGEFILAQKDIKFMQLPDGYYYHYSEVCVMLNRYANQLVGDKEREIEGLNRVISKMFADKVSETRELQKEIERLKLERDKFEGGDQLKAKRIDQLEDAHSKNYDKLTELQSQLLQAQKEVEYWKARCEAAEVVMNSFPRSVLEDQAGEDYLEYEKLKNKKPE